MRVASVPTTKNVPSTARPGNPNPAETHAPITAPATAPPVVSAPANRARRATTAVTANAIVAVSARIIARNYRGGEAAASTGNAPGGPDKATTFTTEARRHGGAEEPRATSAEGMSAFVTRGSSRPRSGLPFITSSPPP
jgi:hypothetical protein